MKTIHAIQSVVSLLLTLWLCSASEWEVLHSWYARAYLVVFAASVLVFLLSRCKSYLAFCVVSACGKFLGVIFFAWLRWGYQAQWMSGWFGMFLIGLTLSFYVFSLLLDALICWAAFRGAGDTAGDS